MPRFSTVVWSDTFDGAAQNFHGYNGWFGDYSPDVTLSGSGYVITPHNFLHDVHHEVTSFLGLGQDYGVRLTLEANGATAFSMGVSMRADTATEGINCYVVEGGTILFSDSSGILDSAAVGTTGTHTITVDCVGTSLKGYYDDVEVCSATAVGADNGDNIGVLLNNNPANTSRWHMIEVLATPPLQIIRPDGDVTRVGWVDEGAGTTNLWDGLDETTTSDADYITVTL